MSYEKTKVKLNDAQLKSFEGLFNEITKGRKLLTSKVKSRNHMNSFSLSDSRDGINIWDCVIDDIRDISIFFDNQEILFINLSSGDILIPYYIDNSEEFIDNLIKLIVIKKAKIIRHNNRNDEEIKSVWLVRKLKRSLKNKTTSKISKI